MIERVDTTSEKTATQVAGKSTAQGGVAFADVHAAAVKASAASLSPGASKTITAASDETWTPIAGVSSYAKITAGPRTGQYVDLTKGSHHGDAFTIEQRDGKSVHVFKAADGTEDAVPAARETTAHHAHRPSDRPAKGETWSPVAGHSGYADILSGKRNGMYVNLSGGPRAGESFQLERRGNQELHIYGEGKDREVVAMPIHHAKRAATGSTGATTKAATG